MEKNSNKAEALKQQGMSQSVANADNKVLDWSVRAFEFLKIYAKANKQFMAEDVRIASAGTVPEPPSQRAWGAVFFKANNMNVISPNGYGITKSAKSRRTPATLWQSEIFCEPKYITKPENFATVRDFIVNTLLPYKNDPDVCSFDKEENCCVYLDKRGNKDAIGQHIKDSETKAFNEQFAVKTLVSVHGTTIFKDYLQDFLNKGLITVEILTYMQWYHDSIAFGNFNQITRRVDRLEQLTGLDLSILRLQQI